MNYHPKAMGETQKDMQKLSPELTEIMQINNFHTAKILETAAGSTSQPLYQKGQARALLQERQAQLSQKTPPTRPPDNNPGEKSTLP